MDFDLLAFPMHGQHKFLAEGYRTRDGHLIEWFGKLLRPGNVYVLSRPEPALLNVARSFQNRRRIPAVGTVAVSANSFKLPKLRARQHWWVKSSVSYVLPLGTKADTPAVVWNPFVANSPISRSVFSGTRPVHLDLLDDWSVHYAFAGIHTEVAEAYKRAFDLSDTVTANSEATLDLAHRHGRTDAVLMTNGCDPFRFSNSSKATGLPTVGYVGKIGKRLNLPLIEQTADALPHVNFVFAGPILDKEYGPALRAHSNIMLLGDVHYEDVPNLLETFDVGWVPHKVGEGEVGGDVIKTYEYRAAGLPVLATPIIGISSRGLGGVSVLDANEHARWLGNQFSTSARVPRQVEPIPSEHSWEGKARSILMLIDPDARLTRAV